jgi:hypothetical protein
MLEYAAWLDGSATTLQPPVELLDTTERRSRRRPSGVRVARGTRVALKRARRAASSTCGRIDGACTGSRSSATTSSLRRAASGQLLGR